MTEYRVSKPIFVVGPSRSGTELVKAALNAHREIFIAGETHYFDDLRPRLSGHGSGALSAEEERLCQDYFLALSHRPYAQGGDPARARLDRDELTELARRLAPGGDGYFQAFCWMSRVLKPGAALEPTRWGEKTPRHVFRLSEMLTRYPDAQAICLTRDPRAVVASYRDWHHNRFDIDAATDNAEALEAEVRRTQASYDPTVLTLIWKAAVNAGEKARTRFGDKRVRIVRYEDLLLDTRSTLTELAQWLGVEFVDSMMDVPMSNSSYNTFDRHGGVSQAPLERWREKLTDNEIAIVDFCAGATLTRSGYSAEPTKMTPTGKAKLGLALATSASKAVWANRNRMGKNPARYVARRVALLVSRDS